MAPAKDFDVTLLIDTLGRTGDAMVALDGNLSVVGWNAAATEMFGYTFTEAAGRRCYEVLGWDDPCGNTVCSGDCPSANPGEPDEILPTCEVTGRTKSGKALWMSVATVTPPPEMRDQCRVVHLIREVAFPLPLIEVLTERTRARPVVDEESVARMALLTSREREVLDLMCEGRDGAAIAEALFLSPTTVRNHIQHVLAKLDVHSRAEAVAMAMRHRS